VTAPAVSVDGLHLRYGETRALDDLTFTLEGGRIYGLLGRNGSGKTSLLSLLAAFRKPTSGTVLVDGEPVWENFAVTSRVCLIRENGDLGEGSDRVSDALDVARQLRPDWDDAYASALLDRFRLPARRKLRELSRGQQSALASAVGLASRAPLTMFDESHLGMDAPTRQAFTDELLADFMAHPRTIIVSTHLIEEMASVFEQVLILDEGRLTLRDDTETLRSRGATVTGAAERVERFLAGSGLRVLNVRELGRTRSVTVDGPLDPAAVTRAGDAGLDVGPVPLQELFTHLTEPEGAR
jgi:ABC-2 type transport system ATP-binding protein